MASTLKSENGLAESRRRTLLRAASQRSYALGETHEPHVLLADSGDMLMNYGSYQRDYESGGPTVM